MLMRTVATAFYFLIATNAIAAPQLRCGWIENTMPSDLSFTDKDGTWNLLNVPGEELLPDTDRGTTCACIKVESDPNKLIINEIYGGKKIPAKRCQQDKNLQ